MAGADRLAGGGGSRVLSSDWGNLSPTLIAKFYPLKRDSAGTGWEQSRDVREISAADNFSVDDGFEVHCPISDGTSEMSLNWTSPFEGAGAESKAPTLSSMLQSGTLSSNLQAFITKMGLDPKSGASDKALSSLAQATGRTGITKLNSTQVFTGMPPIKFSLTMHFRAVSDPLKEVRDPISQFEEWSVPTFLASDGVIANAIQNGASQSLLQTVYPSVSPQIIGMRYGDMTYEPLVIEGVSKPITNPRDESGVMISCSVQVSLATLTAWDRRDFRKSYR